MATSISSRPWQQHYPAGVPTTINYREAPLYSLLEDAAAAHPDLPAIRFYTTRLNYAQLWAQAQRFAAVLAALGKYMSARLPLPAAVWHACDFLVSFGVISALFAMIFKILPNVRIGWRDVWIGGLWTALLFTLGKFLIGLYLGTSSVASSFGAAGSALIVLVWIYYSSCILFFGAEFTKVYACKFGSGIVPNSRAVLVSDLLRAKLGSAPMPR